MSRKAAFFDLDHTLLDCNSGYEWAKHEWQQGRIGPWQMARVSFWALMYRLSWVDLEGLLDEAAQFYAGEPVESLERRTREWFHDTIAHRLRDRAEARLEHHREQGHPLVLLTNSSSFEAEVAVDTWELDDWLANEFHVDDEGRFAGELIEPICYGEGKVERANRWAADRDVDVEQSYFYSDSYSDLPMLERVEHPRVVDPDPRLRREAARRDWPILDW